jgi:hypothetical protein
MAVRLRAPSGARSRGVPEVARAAAAGRSFPSTARGAPEAVRFVLAVAKCGVEEGIRDTVQHVVDRV